MRLLLFLLIGFSQDGFAREWLACVDCYGSAALYVSRAKKLFPDRDLGFIHIRTQKTLGVYEKSFELTRSHYDLILHWSPESNTDTRRIFRELSLRNVIGVVGGMEEGARFEPILSHALGIRSNDPVTSRARRNKEAQQSAIRRTGHGIPTLLSGSVDEILNFTSELSSTRVVLKPDSASGAVMVYFVDRKNPNAVRKTVSAMKGSSDQYGNRVDSIVVQPEIVGDEFVVNTISYNDHTTITGMWRYHKVMLPSGRRVYFVDRPVPLTSPESLELAPIVSKINNAIGLRFGPGHAELIHESGTGRWVLVESGARLMGTGAPAIETRLWGSSQLELNLLRLVEPVRFLNEVSSFPRPMLQDAALVSFIAPGASRYSPHALLTIAKLTHRFEPAPFYGFDPESQIVGTEDLNTSPFTMNLVGPSDSVRSDAFQLFRLMETGRMFEVPKSRCAGWLETGIFRQRLVESWRQISWGR